MGNNLNGKDAIKLIIIFLCTLGIPFLIIKLFWWFWFWVAIAVVLTVTELGAKKLTGKTISTKYWDWRKDPRTTLWQKVMIVTGMIAFWTYLILHLLFEI